MQIQQYLEALGTQTRSSETLRAYRQDLERFDVFLKEKCIRVDQVKSSTITEYLHYLATNKGRTVSATLAPATIVRRLAVLSSYFEWLHQDSDEMVRNPVQKVKRPRIQNALDRAVDDNVLASLLDGITDLRDRALVLLFVYSGLRLSEMRSLDRTTIEVKRELLPDGSYKYLGVGKVTGKGDKQREFLAGMKAVQAVGTYLTQVRATDTNPALFLSSRRQRLSCRAIQQIVGKWCTRSNLSHVHVHQLRHSYATRNVNSGMSAAALQVLLGHASLLTTQRYFHIKSERIAREYFSVMEFVRLSSPV